MRDVGNGVKPGAAPGGGDWLICRGLLMGALAFYEYVRRFKYVLEINQTKKYNLSVLFYLKSIFKLDIIILNKLIEIRAKKKTNPSKSSSTNHSR